MKKVYMLIAMLLIAGIASAQLLQTPKMPGAKVISEKQIVKHNLNLKAGIDTAGWSTNFTPQFASPTAQLGTVGMIDANDNPIGYWCGTSGFCHPDSAEADMWAQCWVNTANVTIEGVLFFAAGKFIMNSGSVANSNLVVGLANMEPYVSGQHGCITGTTAPYTFGPSPVEPYLASATMNIVDIDTTWLNWNYLPFTTMPTTSSDFCVVSDFKGIRTNCGDTAWMYVDATGNGLSMHYSQYCVDWTGYYWISLYAIAPSLDRNMSLFAVISDGAGIEDEGYFQGMKVSLRNIPAVGNFFVDYQLQYASNVTVKMFDINGREVMAINEGKKAAGIVNSVNINTCDLQSGTYFVTLLSDGGRFTKKLIVE
ncbi:MAG TPA: T9SS type A sorting domain-containing protein [Bacteroidales bacterium]|nr:T9SS type A sorting domain-containing protein [Bacteroidales bacterium]HQI70517.1 T9SS type A sorting domain-containing protein [Bacteroidales bacterium]